jgi:predicted transposase/invertase (TIGR01784 family)
LNFTSIIASPKYHHAFHLVDEETGMRYFKDIELHTIELNKFTKNDNDDINSLVAKIKDALDVWIAFLTRNDLLDQSNLPESLDTPGLKKALHVLEVMNFSKEERDTYEDSLRWFRTEVSALKKMYNDTLVKGIEIGKAEGIERTAINMLNQNLESNLISSVTGLSIEDIQKLQAKL